MAGEVAIWSRVIEPGSEVEIESPVSLLIAGAALGAKLNSPTGRTSVVLTYSPIDTGKHSDDEGSDDGEEIKPVSTVLCNLIPEKVEQSLLNITIPGQEKATLKVVGKNAVHLTGNYIDDDEDLSSEDDDSEDDEGYALDEISSDVEMDPDMLDDAELDSDDEEGARIEEVEEEKPKSAAAAGSKKRPRESDAVDEEETPDNASMSKKQLKKLAKKMKAEGGEAAPAAAAAEAKEEKSEKKAEKKDKKEEKKKEETTLVTSKSGLKTKDKKAGEGKKAKKGDLVSMRYIGKLPNGKTFDSNTKGKPFQFRLGVGEVIKGWDEGVAGMAKGGERLIIVPPELGYGKKPSGPIPANSTLHFEVKLIDIKN